MNRIKFLNAIFLGVLVYVLLSIFFGQQGIWAYNQLHEYQISVSENINTIKKNNETIEMDKNALQYDDDVACAYAHSMGFIRENENLVKITGINSYTHKVYEAGTEIKKPQIVFMPDWMAKGAGFIVFLLINLINSLAMLINLSANSHSHKKMVLNTAAVTTGEIHDNKKN